MIGGSGAAGEAVPKIESDGFGPMWVPLVPPIRRRFEEGCLLRYGASWNKRVYAKREAASARALSAEESQTEEKVKSRRHANARKFRNSCIVGAERMVNELIASAIASLSIWKTTCLWRSSSPQQRIAWTAASISFTWMWWCRYRRGVRAENH